MFKTMFAGYSKEGLINDWNDFFAWREHCLRKGLKLRVILKKAFLIIKWYPLWTISFFRLLVIISKTSATHVEMVYDDYHALKNDYHVLREELEAVWFEYDRRGSDD